MWSVCYSGLFCADKPSTIVMLTVPRMKLVNTCRPVYEQGIKGLAGAGMEGAVKVFHLKRSHEYQASEHHLLII